MTPKEAIEFAVDVIGNRMKWDSKNVSRAKKLLSKNAEGFSLAQAIYATVLMQDLNKIRR